MTKPTRVGQRAELKHASDEQIAEAVRRADPTVLRSLLLQLTGDDVVATAKVKTVLAGIFEIEVLATKEEIALVRERAVAYLAAYRDADTDAVDFGPPERFKVSIPLLLGTEIPDRDLAHWIAELGLDPWARCPEWPEAPSQSQLDTFAVVVIGAGMGGLNAAIQLTRAGISYSVIEKNPDVGGTWYENRYPGARVDTPSRSYTHTFAADYPYPYTFSPWQENLKYFEWVADTFKVRDSITFDTEVRSMTWDPSTSLWQIETHGPDGVKVIRANAVITAVGFLNRPQLPDIEGLDDFGGTYWHTARWPETVDLTKKRVAVVGSGASGQQLITELSLEVDHLTVFQRTPQWLFPVPGYRARLSDQVTWLDRNLPLYTNFMRLRTIYRVTQFNEMSEVDPDFHDPESISPMHKRIRDELVAFLHDKLGNSQLQAKMTPKHVPFSSRPILIDRDYSFLDALARPNVELVSEGIRRVNAAGVQTADGVQHDLDVIVFATGFHANDYLFPMEIRGRGGLTTGELWREDGARAYLGCMLPGFPNLWTIFGPNTNGGLNVSTFHELISRYAVRCVQEMILAGKKTTEVTVDAYDRYNALVDERNRRKAWADPRTQSYYWDARYGRSATMCPLNPCELAELLMNPVPGDLEVH